MAETQNQNNGDWATRGAYWVKTAPQGASKTDDLNQILIDLAGIGPGDRVLDIASGAGDPALSIALKVGPQGSVTAFDANPEMLDGARGRAEKMDLSNMAFEIGRMEELPFDGAGFDAVTYRFGLMSAEDPVAALTGARRALKAGKKAAYMTHGSRDKSTLFSVLGPAVHGFLGEPDTGGAERRFRFSEKGSLEKVFKSAGFKNIEEREASKTDIREKDGRFWQTMLLRSFGARIEGFEEARLEELHGCIEQAFAPYLKGDHYELLSTEMVACGTA